MSRDIDILCIDGVTAVGKTMQIGLYRNLLKLQGRKYEIFDLCEVNDPKETTNQLLKITEYLRKNPNCTILCDGSIATDIADDMAKNMLFEDIWDAHQENLQIYTSMNQEFKIVNILLTPINIKMCKKRLEKKRDVFGQDIEKLSNIGHLKRVSNILKTFDDNTITTNIIFNNIQIDELDTMLDVHEKIKEIIAKS